MISYKFLQYNTDNLRLGWPILEQLAGQSDFLLLQRFPKDKQKELCNITGKAFLGESVTNKNLSLAIGRANGLSSVGGIETINLPSSQLVQAVGNEWQGCSALKGMYNNKLLVSALPCYPESIGEFPISKADNEKDIKFLLETFKDEPTIIAGDFHFSPEDNAINDLIEANGFKSYLDGHKTFKSSSNGQMMNLDKLLCNFPIDISDIIVHNTDIDIQQGHFPITYTLSWEANPKD
tara:strand:+ start:977 stop:1684 length:708 start_codon:yes stop_codon:yes gene_type:complete